MARAYQPIDPDRLPVTLGDAIAARQGIVRVAVDGPPLARPDELAPAVATRLRELGRDTVVIAAESFWRDASLRLENGRDDPDSLPGWLDTGALRREVLDAVVADGRLLPSLRDPHTNRATRAPYRPTGADTVVLVAGALLLGQGLPFDVSIHLAVSPGARQRGTATPDQWTLAAFDRYDSDVRPRDAADAVVRYDDPRHPALATN